MLVIWYVVCLCHCVCVSFDKEKFIVLLRKILSLCFIVNRHFWKPPSSIFRYQYIVFPTSNMLPIYTLYDFQSLSFVFHISRFSVSWIFRFKILELNGILENIKFRITPSITYSFEKHNSNKAISNGIWFPVQRKGHAGLTLWTSGISELGKITSGLGQTNVILQSTVKLTRKHIFW